MVTNESESERERERERERRRDKDELLGILDFRKIGVPDLIWVLLKLM